MYIYIIIYIYIHTLVIVIVHHCESILICKSLFRLLSF